MFPCTRKNGKMSSFFPEKPHDGFVHDCKGKLGGGFDPSGLGPSRRAFPRRIQWLVGTIVIQPVGL
jgi:hypothetical protein